MINYFFQKNKIVILFFSLYLIIGIFFFKDYGISADEDINRLNGLVSLKYILQKIGFENYFNEKFHNIPDLLSYDDNIYGVVFDLPLALLEFIFNFDDLREVYLFRHLITFLIFFISVIFFYKLLLFRYKNYFTSLLGALILITSPRIFSDSFYNSKDITFLSLIIIATYFNIKSFKYGLRFLILGSLFTALAAGLRINGIYIIFINFLFFFLNYKKKNNFIKYFIFNFLFFFVFLYIFSPFLWNEPFKNLYLSLAGFSKFDWNGYELYLGEHIKAKYVPWHYFFVWLFVTTPIIYLFFIFIGIFKVTKILIKNFISINVNRRFLLWKDENQMIEIYCFLIFFIPIFMILIFNSTLYNGWRHLYFVYPSLVFMAINGLIFIKSLFRNNIYRAALILIIFQCFYLIFYIFRNHPVQSVYFNDLSKSFVINNFYYDYWGLSNKIVINKLIEQEYIGVPLKISNASLVDLNKVKIFLDKKDRNKIQLIGNQNKETADYIYTNFYYITQSKTDKKWTIPEGFKSIIRFELDGLLISEVYKKNEYN